MSLTPLDCSVCYNEYKDPRVLQCGHTFCLACISKLIHHGIINCPTCRNDTSTEKIQVNYVVKQIIEDKNQAIKGIYLTPDVINIKSTPAATKKIIKTQPDNSKESSIKNLLD